MKHLITAAALLVATFSLAQDKMTSLLDWFINPNHRPIIVAKELGCFLDQGLEVEIIPSVGPSAPHKQVAAGQGDIAASCRPSQHLHAAEGLPLVRVGILIATPLSCLLVLEDGPTQEIRQLISRDIGAPDVLRAQTDFLIHFGDRHECHPISTIACRR